VNDADRDGDAAPQRRLHGRLDVVRALAAGGSDLNARNVLGQTAWNLAREHGLLEIADWLAANGANQDAPRFPALVGDYLGQATPGRMPREFAVRDCRRPFRRAQQPAFSPDGRELYWSESTRHEAPDTAAAERWSAVASATGGRTRSVRRLGRCRWRTFR